MYHFKKDTCMQGAITLRVRFSCVLSKSQYCCAHKILHMLLCGDPSLALYLYSFDIIIIYVRSGQYRFVSDSFGPIR